MSRENDGLYLRVDMIKEEEYLMSEGDRGSQERKMFDVQG